MRHLTLLVLFGLLVLTAGCGKKPDAAPDVGVAVEPAPEPAPQPKKKWPPKPGDPNNFAGKSLAQWREDLKSKDRVKLIHAMKVMQVFGPEAADAIPDILAASGSVKGSPNSAEFEIYLSMYHQVLPDVIQAIGKPAAQQLSTILTEAKGADDPATRSKISAALSALFELGPDAEAAVPAVVKLAQHPNLDIQRQAVYALANMGPAAKSAIPTLRAALKSPDDDIRYKA